MKKLVIWFLVGCGAAYSSTMSPVIAAFKTTIRDTTWEKSEGEHLDLKFSLR